MRTLDCRDRATFRSPFGGEVINNAWNRKAAGSFAAEQCVVERHRPVAPASAASAASGAPAGAPPTTVRELGWRWRWPTRGALYAYPSLVVGATPWHDGPGNDARFPRAIRDIRAMPLRYDLEIESDGQFNVAAEMWIVDKPVISAPPDVHSIRTELMIWTDASPGVAEAGPMPRVGEVRIAGRDWYIHSQEGWGPSMGTPNTWRFVIYFAKESTRAIAYDMKAFLDDAIARGFVSRDHYVADVELGNELISGTGVTWIRDFSLTVE